MSRSLQEHIENEPITISTLGFLVTLVLGILIFAEDAKAWLADEVVHSDQLQQLFRSEVFYGIAIHTAAGAHVEANLLAAKTRAQQHESMITLLKLEKRDYKSRIYTRTNGGSVETTPVQRMQVRHYEEIIGEIDDQIDEHEESLRELNSMINQYEEEIRTRPIPGAPV